MSFGLSPVIIDDIDNMSFISCPLILDSIDNMSYNSSPALRIACCVIWDGCILNYGMKLVNYSYLVVHFS